MFLPVALRQHAESRPDAPAFVTAVGPAVSYVELVQRVDSMARWLDRAGIHRHHRVAIVLPAGNDLAMAITTVLCNAVAVPLDPAMPRAEFLELLDALRIDAILTIWGDLAPVQWSVRSTCEDSAFGGQSLHVRDAGSRLDDGAQRDTGEALALIVRTSGTTAMPKLVAATHENIAEWGDQMRRRLALTPADRSMCVSPLHYSQALQTALIAPLFSGGSVAFPPRLDQRDDAADTPRWLDELRPTWLSTGPTFLLNLLERSVAGRDELQHSLRFIQTGGSPLRERTRDQLEKLFKVPVLEAYGMSEGGQVAAEGWDPAHRKHASVGRYDPGRLAIVDDQGLELISGTVGNIVVRGPALSPGYIVADGSLQPLLDQGWFKTGDLGFISDDGFLSLTGRRKEIINRGGEKIAPLEIDRALGRHPDVQEAAAFAVPHARLGEDVAAAVVLRTGARVSPSELRGFLRGQLAPFKVPHRIHLVKHLAKGSTGKIDRPVIARQALNGKTLPSIAPGSTLELEIVQLWRRLLQQDSLGPGDDFFASGGDSLLAVQMREELETIVGLKISDTLMLDASTARELAEAIVASDPAADTFLVPLRQRGSRQPLIFVDGDINGGGYYMRRIADQLGEDRPLWLLRPFDATDTPPPPIEVMAGHYLRLMREAGLRPPYLLGGHCNGALLALEVARQAQAAGEQTSLVVMIDPISLNARLTFRLVARAISAVMRLAVRLPERRRELYERAMTSLWNSTRTPLHQQSRNLRALWDGTANAAERAFDRRMNAYFTAMACHLPGKVHARLVCFIPEESRRRRLYAHHPWTGHGLPVESIHVPGGHLTCVTTEARPLATKLREILEAY